MNRREEDTLREVYELQLSPSYEAFLKSPYRSIKHSTYFHVYDELFSKFRGLPITFVEIGVLGGGSLFMWRHFFGNQARIVGVDFNPEAKRWEKDGFEIYIGDQADPEFWDRFKTHVPSIDILLDDGGHTYSQQIMSTEMILGILNDRGMVVLEDIHTSYLRGFGNQKYSAVKYAEKLIDRMNSRFEVLQTSQTDQRVWSIRFFESFIVFEVNKKALALNSFPIENIGIDLGTVDFRHNENWSLALFNRFVPRILRKIPGGDRLVGFVQQSIANFGVKTKQIKKYFE